MVSRALKRIFLRSSASGTEIGTMRLRSLGFGLMMTILGGMAGPQAAPLWLNGDTHVHDDHSADGSLLRQTIGQGSAGNLSVADQVHEGERSGLAFMPLTDHRTYDQHYDPLWESGRLLLVPGEEANGSPHATVLGAVDSIVQGAVPPGLG